MKPLPKIAGYLSLVIGGAVASVILVKRFKGKKVIVVDTNKKGDAKEPPAPPKADDPALPK